MLTLYRSTFGYSRKALVMNLKRTFLLSTSIVLLLSGCSNTENGEQHDTSISVTESIEKQVGEIVQDEQSEARPTEAPEVGIDKPTIAPPAKNETSVGPIEGSGFHLQTPILEFSPTVDFSRENGSTFEISAPIVAIAQPTVIESVRFFSLGKGVFLDSKVSGLSYITPNTSGTTNENGEFYFRSGDSIEFSLGGLVLGTVEADDLFFYDPLSFSLGVSMPSEQFDTALATPLIITPGAESEEDRRVVNKLIFLQTLDINGNPDDGIDIPDIISSEIGNWNIDFDIPVDQFSKGDFSLFVDYISELELFTDNYPRQITTKIDALIHFKKFRPSFSFSWPEFYPGLSIGPPRFDVYWGLDDECSTTIHSIFDVNGDDISFTPISSEETAYTGVRISNGKVLFPSFEINSSCPEVCSQPTIKPNFIYQLGELTGTISAYCDIQDPATEHLITPTITRHVYVPSTWDSWGSSTNSVISSH